MPPHPVDRLVQTVANTLEELLPVTEPPRLLLAVSGGADSMALLHLLHRANYPIAVAHFDHQTRDGASTSEGDFVAETAHALKLPVHRGHGDIQVMGANAAESFEMLARSARYTFLAETVRAQGYGAIATGHHADDQAETVLLRLLRGTSTTGLGGIRPFSHYEGIPLLRPLLNFRHAALVDWLQANALPWCEDGSNASTDYVRNQVRHDLLPALAHAFNPRIVDALNHLADNQQRDDALLQQLTEAAHSQCVTKGSRLCRESFRTLDSALQHRVMAQVILGNGGESTFETVRRAVRFLCDRNAGKQLDLGNNVTLYLATDHAVVASRDKDGTITVPIPLVVPGEATATGTTFCCRYRNNVPDAPLKRFCTPQRQLFDADQITGSLTVRTRQPGDRFHPLGMAGSKKLKDYFNDLGLTRPERDQQLLVTSGERILWVVGHAIDASVAVTTSTSRFLEIECATRCVTFAYTVRPQDNPEKG